MTAEPPADNHHRAMDIRGPGGAEPMMQGEPS